MINFKSRALVITEKQNSSLFRICEEEEIKFIEHNPNIGGRFSCFSITGLLPAKLAGLNSNYIKKLSNLTFKEIINNNKYSFVDNLASLLCLNKTNKYKGHTVLSYQKSLISLMQWYRQLWGESLGKNKNALHLMPALGSLDQHSQLQMWLGGPNNILYTIIIPRKREKDLWLRADKKKLIPYYLEKKSLGNILNSMAFATYKALVKAGRPVRLVYLDNSGLYPAVKLMSFLMLEVSILGKCLNINPFNQPAVESVKLLTKKILKQDG